MRRVYSAITSISDILLKITPLFSRKMKLFVQGRKGLFEKLERSLGPDDKTIWFHCASLGEFEQGLPIMQAVKTQYPQHRLVLTFFSPSGYEVKKDAAIADVVSYLPSDTIAHCRRFLDLVHPDLAFFVKYEFWPNYLFELRERDICTLLVSGLFRKDQPFFAPHGGFMRRALRCFNWFFVQDESSAQLLKEIGLENSTVSGDTRFDRVSRQLEQDNTVEGIENFLSGDLCVVCGSTWPEDDQLLLPYIQAAPKGVKFIMAPHVVEPRNIQRLQDRLEVASQLYSNMRKGEKDSSVLIIDRIGLLARLYSYAHVAYIGGGMGKTGLHNILEPATFGVPIIIGKNYDKFPEAIRLESLAGLFSIRDYRDLKDTLDRLLKDHELRRETGLICEHFIQANTGATAKVLEYLKTLNRDRLV